MKVLFLGVSIPSLIQPWYGDVETALGDDHEIARYDPSRPAAAQFAGVDVVIDQAGAVGTRALIDAALEANVKLWQVTTTGVDHVDVAYFLKNGLRLANTPGQFTATPLAEHALCLMLFFAKNVVESQRNVRAGVFYEPMNEELSGQTLGVIGLGASGRELAKIARTIGMRVIAIDKVKIDRDVLDELEISFCGGIDDLDRVVRQADYLSIHAPLNESSRQMIDRRVLGLMKPTAVLINLTRGEIVDEEALAEMLATGRLRGAGLDAFQEEPLPAGHPFLELENVLATGHVSAVTPGSSRRRAEAAAENVKRLAAGLEPLYVITSIDSDG